jgi:hypothetical protein
MTPLDQARKHLASARAALPPAGDRDDDVFAAIDGHITEALQHVDAARRSLRPIHRQSSDYLMYSDPHAPGLIELLQGRGDIARTLVVYFAVFLFALVAFTGLTA